MNALTIRAFNLFPGAVLDFHVGAEVYVVLDVDRDVDLERVTFTVRPLDCPADIADEDLRATHDADFNDPLTVTGAVVNPEDFGDTDTGSIQ